MLEGGLIETAGFNREVNSKIFYTVYYFTGEIALLSFDNRQR